MPTLALVQAAADAAEPAPGPASQIGWAIAGLLIIGFVVAIVINSRRARPEVGAELELAPNRKPYMSDEELEGKKLDRTLGAGLLLLAMISVAVPMYWLYEPARQTGAIENRHEEAVAFGLEVYEVKAKCAECHGPKGVGGAKETPILNEKGEFVGTYTWQAPALNTVLYRYSREEVKFILNYGRQNTPMPAWGAPGGGALTDQQLDNVITYLESIQLPAEEVRASVDKEIKKVCAPDAAGHCTIPDPGDPQGRTYTTLGQALFNLGQWDGFAGGAFSCARCHTKGWSYGEPQQAGGGALGPNLTNGRERALFESAESQADFVAKGSELGKRFGRDGNGSGQMPGFGINPNAEDTKVPTTMTANQVMLTDAQIAAIVGYERDL
jgi:mono/diheme cytochrome c family protein